MEQTTLRQAAPKNKKHVEFIATGKRKTSIARARLASGNGTITVNGKPLDVFFGRQTLRMIVNEPFETTGNKDKFNVSVNVQGGGSSGQAGAVRHAISRALLQIDAELRKPLKANGLLTRDSREKERRKVGCRKARRRPQYSKR
ncbi:MAG: 30S ribosomal protein S9 [Deltaproteobacteria bacterium]|nr:30S ribosomal protein S9 [Deltaproteobacteria bacterium]